MHMTMHQWLKQFRADLFDAAFDEDICDFKNVNQLADAAGLTWQTVEKLRVGDTKRPSLNTVRQLCIATGMDFRIVAGDMKQIQTHKRYRRSA